MRFHLPGPEDTVRLGRALAKALLHIDGLRVVLLAGTLGSGKTTMTRGLVAELPGGGMAEVSSPSFNICNLYPTTPPTAHFDLYRLEGNEPDDALLDLIDEGESIILIEWAEHLPEYALPPVWLRLAWHAAGEGRIVEAHGNGAPALVALDMVAAGVPDLVQP
ncbi:MAG TPA: tRNA (adenosine(37)-N6)-threonylcarbamoyltransferase complex ATPase subunit type 1 TsaE [Desulfovibrio sp.]|nr:tRNA (adenosine(37)-N6)-threonylcarbamoyltransferase complex ATPase subunit type 1 TsaE [Desulfovibrio sp.]